MTDIAIGQVSVNLDKQVTLQGAVEDVQQV